MRVIKISIFLGLTGYQDLHLVTQSRTIVGTRVVIGVAFWLGLGLGGIGNLINYNIVYFLRILPPNSN